MGWAIAQVPRVDVTFPNFGAASGCSNAADPTGTNDSTCAINAAYAFGLANQVGPSSNFEVGPTIYFPRGVYKISSALRFGCNVLLEGDGPTATIIEPVTNTANAFTILGNATGYNNPILSACMGGMSNLSIVASGYHNYTATLVEMQNAEHYTMRDVRLAGGGGRGLSLNGGTERSNFWNLQIDNVRWPIVMAGATNEDNFFKTTIANAGEAGDNYCYGANCPNGVFPNDSWNSAATTISAAVGSGTTATFTIQCNGHCGTGNGISPVAAGHWFQIAGIGDLTALNGIWKVASVANNSPVSGSFTITTTTLQTGGNALIPYTYGPDQMPMVLNPSAVSVTGTSSSLGSATFQPILWPQMNAAVFASGAQISFIGGSIKANWYSGCVQGFQTGAFTFQNMYCEGFPVNGQPHTNPDAQASGYFPYTTLTATLSGTGCSPSSPCAVPVTNSQWFPNYANDATNVSDIDIASSSTATAVMILVCPDYNPASTASCAAVSGVTQKQFEVVNGAFANDGQFHITARNQSGSTAPTNTAWPSGAKLAVRMTNVTANIDMKNNHLNSQDGPASQWAIYCNPLGPMACSQLIAGSTPDYEVTFPVGISSFDPGSITDEGSMANTGCTAWGSGCTTIESSGTLTVVNGMNVNVVGAETAAGTVNFNLTDQTQGIDYTSVGGSPSTPTINSVSGNSRYVNIGGGGYSVETAAQGNLTNAAAIIGSTFSAKQITHQFTSADCWYDIPASGGTHALNRFCFKGSPDETGSAAGFEVDIWNGTAWVLNFATPGGSTQNVKTASGYLNENLTTSTSGSTFNAPLISADGFSYWTGSASSPVRCGWQYLSNTASTVTPTGITRTYSCNRSGANLGIPLTMNFTLPSGSIADFTAFTTFKMPAGATVANAVIATNQFAGRATLASGTATVSTSAASTSANYVLTRCAANSSTAIGVPSVGTVTAGTSFVINALSATNTVATGDLSTVCWWIH
jgi:hypothetical protein